MSAQISQHNGGGGTPRSAPLSVSGGLSHLVGGGGAVPSSPKTASPYRPTPKLLLGSDMVVKTERNVDDGVDLSFDSSVKKENFEIKVESNSAAADVKIKTENENPLSQPSQNKFSSTGGRLKVWKEGRVLVELTHRFVGEGEKESWVTTGSKKLYWPPGPACLTARLDSNASTNTMTGSDGSGESGLPPMSPWGGAATTPSPRPTPWQPSPPHRIKSVPKKWPLSVSNGDCDENSKIVCDRVFGVKPPQGVRNYRKKIRTFRRRCRQPTSDIKIGLFVLRMECQANVGKIRPKKPLRDVTSQRHQQRCARLETLIGKLVTRKSALHVPINAWRTGRTDLAHLVKNPPSQPSSPIGPKSAGLSGPASPNNQQHLQQRSTSCTTGVTTTSSTIYPLSSPARHPVMGHQTGMRVKSELKMVTETCTAGVVSSVASPPRHTIKVKAETRTVTAETRPVPVRSLPITPTVGRVKSEPDGGGAARLKASAITSLMSPEMARVRMDIGPVSRDRNDQSPTSFLSPRKRYLRDFDGPTSSGSAATGVSPAKHRRLSTEHRLSTDSLGSTGDRSSPYQQLLQQQHQQRVGGGGSASPQPPRGGVGVAAAKAPFSSFSIDSLISSSSAPSSSSGLPQPSSPSRSASSASGRRESSSTTVGSYHPQQATGRVSAGATVDSLAARLAGGGGVAAPPPGSPGRLHHPHLPPHVGLVNPTPTRPSPTPGSTSATGRNSPATIASSSSGPSPLLHPSAAAANSAAAAAAAASYPPFLYPPHHHPLLAAAPGMFDPRLAHLAALSQATAAAAGGGPAPTAPYPLHLYPAFNPYLAAASVAQQHHLAAAAAAAAAAAVTTTTTAALPSATSLTSTSCTYPTSIAPPAASVWTPPVATPTPPNSNSSASMQREETPTPTPSVISPPATYHPPLTTCVTSSAAGGSYRPPPPIVRPTASSALGGRSSAPPRPISPPRAFKADPDGGAQSTNYTTGGGGRIQEAHKQPESAHFQTIQSAANNEAPLNLSMKPTSL